MDQTTNSLYCSIYDFLENNKLSSTKKNFVKETQFNTSLLKDSSIVKVSLKKLFEDHLTSLKKEVIKEESSDSGSSSSSSSSSDSSDSESDSDDPVTRKQPSAKASSSSSDSSDSSDSDSVSDSDSDCDANDEVTPASSIRKAKSSSNSDSSDSDSDSDSNSESKAKSSSTSSSSSSSESESSECDSEEERLSTTKRKAGSMAKASSNNGDSDPVLNSQKKLKLDSPNGTNSTYKAYVKGLPWTTSEDEVSSFFEDCGKVISVELPLAEGGRSSGTAFVTFGSKESLDAAIAKDEAIWPGTERWLRITQAKSFDSQRMGPPTERPSGCDTVFVGNLPWDVEESQLMDLFSPCGDVLQIRFAMGEDGSFRGFAHVRFGSEDSTDSAVALYGTYVNGRAIRIDYAPPRNRDSLGSGKGGGRGGFGGKGGGRGGARGGTPFSSKKKTSLPLGTKTTFDE